MAQVSISVTDTIETLKWNFTCDDVDTFSLKDIRWVFSIRMPRKCMEYHPTPPHSQIAQYKMGLTIGVFKFLQYVDSSVGEVYSAIVLTHERSRDDTNPRTATMNCHCCPF